ncbi:MAG: hypothetical protein M0Z47_04030 [Actinomycetota bacterium]|nr:hypothetical protein [Actinomycetota bacterium]
MRVEHVAKQSTYPLWGGIEGFDPKRGAAEVASYYLAVGAIAGVVLGVLIGVLLALVGVPGGASTIAGVVVIVASLVVAVVGYSQAGADETRLLDLTPMDDDSAPRAESLVEGISATIGLEPPNVYLLDEPQINALALQGPGRTGAVVVTSGALELLTRLELEALLARELVKIRSGEVGFEAKVRAFRRVVGRFWPGAVPTVYTRAMLGRDIAGDVGALTATRFPPALISLLQKAEEIKVQPTSDPKRRLFGPFWFIPELRDVVTAERLTEISEY